jgi:hypothetical protein
MVHFLGNFGASQALESWLHAPSELKRLSYGSVCIVFGSPGTGKTYGVQSACQACGKDLTLLDSQEIASFKEFRDRLEKLAFSDVSSQFRIRQQSNRIICLDELEAVLSFDRTFLPSLVKLLEAQTLAHIPLIITCHYGDQKKLLDLCKKVHVVELYAPSDTDVYLFLKQKYAHVPAETLLTIAEQCYGNIAHALHMLEMEKSQTITHGKVLGNAEIEKIPSLIEVYARPDRNINRRVFHEDPWLHPLRFHENLPFELQQRKGLQCRKLATYQQILEGLCTWDQMMSALKGGDLSSAIEYVSHVALQVHDHERKKGASASMDEFTKMFSHLSLEKKNQMMMADSDWYGMQSYHKQVYDQLTRKSKKISA